MRLFKLKIKTISNFATPIQGDTLFGQICWAINYKYGNDVLEELLENYENKPFLVVSDAFPSGYLPKPNMPMKYLDEDKKTKKENIKKTWIKFDDLRKANYKNAKNIKGIENRKDFDTKSNIMKNSLNYLNSRTQKGKFAPFGVDEYLVKDFDFDIYFLLSSNFEKEKLLETVDLVSTLGYGKNTSIGKGKFTFDFKDLKELKLDDKTHTYMSLSAICLENLSCEKVFYTPFTKFGKNSIQVKNNNPFKKPILLANTSTVIKYNLPKKELYDGKAIKGISSFEKAVTQAYSILFPIKDI